MTQEAPVVVVTGASSGIGRAVALRTAAQGCHVALVGREERSLQAVARACERAGSASATVEPLDVGSDDAVAGLVERMQGRHGRLDAVVHVAGVVAYGRVEDVPVEVFDGVLRTNLLGSANIARHVLPVLRSQGRGHLVLTGSVLGHLAVPGMTAYVVSKWGVRSLARQLQLETRDLPHVHVSYVAPGGVDTPIYETAANYLGFRGRPPAPVTTPEHVARAIGRVLVRPRKRVQVGLANGVMRAGFSLLPGVYDLMVGPLFGVAAVDRTTPVAPGPGNVLEPDAAGHTLRGGQGNALVAVGHNVSKLFRERTGVR
ncbi:MAG: SDR family NAD(P)-dependent oxidoreductase [Nocardioides sp.]